MGVTSGGGQGVADSAGGVCGSRLSVRVSRDFLRTGNHFGGGIVGDAPPREACALAIHVTVMSGALVCSVKLELDAANQVGNLT